MSVGVSELPRRMRLVELRRSALVVPLLISAASATLFAVIRPGVPDLEAALARQVAAARGVGLTYWFQWFGGGSTPGQYSVITPRLSAWLTAPVLGALASVAITLLAGRLLAGTQHRVPGMYLAAVTSGLSLWSGRIAFAVGAAVAVFTLIALRERRVLVGVLGAVVTVGCSPVAGVFLGMALFAAWITERAYRRQALVLMIATGATLLTLSLYFGSPGPQIYRPISAVFVCVFSLLLVLARPARAVQVVAVLTAVASPILLVVPNAMGSNLSRMPYICLPAAVLATAAVRKWLAVLIVAPAVIACGVVAVHDVRVATAPAASTSYYNSLAAQLDRMHKLPNYRLEVVQSRSFHTADYALLDHAALATGWETQELSRLDAVLTSPTLDAATYRRWLDDNAVGYVAFDRRSPDAIDHEYHVVARGLDYLTPVWRDTTWTLYRVQAPTPIVPSPATLQRATQSELTIRVPCACEVPVRVRWSKFLVVRDESAGLAGQVRRDADGWTVVTVPVSGTYELKGA